MRSLLLLGAACLATACMDRAEAPLHLEASVEARTFEPGFAFVPDGEDEPEVETPPAPAPNAPSLVVIEPDEYGADQCGFDVKAIGLPAVRDDGRVVAFLEDDPTGNAEGWVGGSDFVTVDRDDIEGSDRRRLTDDIWERGGDEGELVVDADACRSYAQRLRQRVGDYNAELRRYRPMQQLDVVVVDPERVGETDPSTILPANTVAAEDRPVQALYRAGWFALRVPGLRVLSREAKLEWRVADEFCDTDPHIQEIWGDRISGAGVAVVDHTSGGCLCDDAITVHTISVPPAVFDELAVRPSERYLQLVDATCEAAAIC